MVWNKTDTKITFSILKALENCDKSYNQIAQELKVSPWIVGDTCRKFASIELQKQRYSASCSKSKQGNKNPMYGKNKENHHNAKEDVLVSGYKTVFKPEGWKGRVVKSNRIYEHQYVWTKNYNMSYVPKGYVVHHLDLNKDNNSIENLQLLSISEHITLHNEIRKEQRLSRKGVGDSISEAPSPSKEGDDIV